MNLERKTVHFVHQRLRLMVLLQVANERLKDATVLQKQKRYNGAVYLGGYVHFVHQRLRLMVIECLLKAAICVHLNQDTLPAAYRIHELPDLLYFAGLLSFLQADERISQRFAIVEGWNVGIRYYGRRFDSQETRRFLSAVREVREWVLRLISP